MTRGEDRVTTFLFTAAASGCLTESITRFISLMRLTPSVVICGVLGTVALVLLLLQMGLASDG